ncbi:MAG: MBL fold metallo-hydrolase [Proteobacteria bacterium]|nr:MBL fold metallo-hydrolase [Pseudomonadota bacterium]
MQTEAFYDKATGTISYVVFDDESKDAIIIDPVLDFDPIAVRVTHTSAQRLLSFVSDHELKVHYIVETHAHADHLSSSQLLKAELGAKIAIGEHIQTTQATFKAVFQLEDDFKTDGSQFDRLLGDGETLEAGSLSFQVLHTPGHTPADISLYTEGAVYTGDALFMPDFGTGRCDFPDGSAENLYTSITEKLYTLPEDTTVYVGHDYGTADRGPAWVTTIAACRAENKQLRAGVDRETFVDWRKARDAVLKPPRLLFQSVQVNVRAGQMPPAEENGRSYLKIPVGLFD